MNPAFSAAMLQQYIIVFNQQARILVKRLRNRADTNVVTDLWRYISDMNFDTVTGKKEYLGTYLFVEIHV